PPGGNAIPRGAWGLEKLLSAGHNQVICPGANDKCGRVGWESVSALHSIGHVAESRPSRNTTRQVGCGQHHCQVSTSNRRECIPAAIGWTEQLQERIGQGRRALE